MNKRLRKKKHRGEFKEMDFRVAVRMQPNLSVEEWNHFMDRFIAEAIEANGLMFGGGGRESDNTWDGVVALWDRGSVTLEHRSKIEQWLIGEPLVMSYYLGEFVDGWYGPWTEETPQDGWIQKGK